MRLYRGTAEVTTPIVRAGRAFLRTRRADRRTASPANADGLGYLFVLTYGRSGSTLLQGILNSIPGYLVRGENRGAMGALYNYHTMVTKDRDARLKSAPIPVTHPWFGIDGYPDETAYASMRQLALSTIIRPRPDSRVVGYKEIRWPQTNLRTFIDFLRHVFPGARFIVNTRSHEAVAGSKWWAGQPDALDRIAAMEDNILEVADYLDTDAFHVHFDDYIADPGKLAKLFDWLGEDFDEAVVRATMARKHSY